MATVVAVVASVAAEAATEVAVEAVAAEVAAVVVWEAVLKSPLNPIDSLVFSLPDLRKTLWSLDLWPLVKVFTTKRESKLLMNPVTRSNTEFGMLTDLSSLPLFWVVLKASTSAPVLESSIWVLLLVLLFPTLLISSDPYIFPWLSSSYTK